MEEILHQLIGILSHYLQGFSTIPGGWPWDFWTINSCITQRFSIFGQQMPLQGRKVSIFFGKITRRAVCPFLFGRTAGNARCWKGENRRFCSSRNGFLTQPSRKCLKLVGDDIFPEEEFQRCFFFNVHGPTCLSKGSFFSHQKLKLLKRKTCSKQIVAMMWANLWK